MRCPSHATEIRLEIDAATGFLPIAVTGRLGSFGTAEFQRFLGLRGLGGVFGSWGRLRWQRCLSIVLVHDNSRKKAG